MVTTTEVITVQGHYGPRMNEMEVIATLVKETRIHTDIIEKQIHSRLQNVVDILHYNLMECIQG